MPAPEDLDEPETEVDLRPPEAGRVPVAEPNGVQAAAGPAGSPGAVNGIGPGAVNGIGPGAVNGIGPGAVIDLGGHYPSAGRGDDGDS